MRQLAAEFADWKDLADWSWAARFGYQVVVKRGAAGTFFRALLSDFLRESAARVPGLAQAAPAEEMDAIAARWCDLAAILKEQSERTDCDPDLFAQVGRLVTELADREERFFETALSSLS
jgi:hypothetical protein